MKTVFRSASSGNCWPIHFSGDRITHQNSSGAIHLSPRRACGQLRRQGRLETADPVQIQRGEDDRLNLPDGIKNRITETDSGLADRLRVRKIANREGTSFEHAAKKRVVI